MSKECNRHTDTKHGGFGYCQASASSGQTNADSFIFYYYDQDHLGNIRQVTKANKSKTGTVIQTNNYYPFGAEFCDNSSKSYVQKHKYNGKEFDNMHGLNSYDYGARQYNPVTARWDRIDPHCESYYNTNPYAYANSNPIEFVDVDGRDWYSCRTPEGGIIYEWYDGSEEREGYTNEGATHIVTNGNCTYTFEQNEMVSMTENVLTEDDFCSQMQKVGDQTIKKDGQEGNCFYQAGKMVSKSGATSLPGAANDIKGNNKMLSYVENQIAHGNAVRVHVDRKSRTQTYDGNGDHWVVIMGITYDFRTGKISYRHFDPGTRHNFKGTDPQHAFVVSGKYISALGGPDGVQYHMVAVRKNKGN